jgi:hypothetical protein
MSALPSIADPLLEESPCDLCPLVDPCRDEKLACDQFQSFYKFGGVKWKTELREPSQKIFAKIFTAPKARRPRKVTAAVESAQRAMRLNTVHVVLMAVAVKVLRFFSAALASRRTALPLGIAYQTA